MNDDPGALPANTWPAMTRPAETRPAETSLAGEPEAAVTAAPDRAAGPAPWPEYGLPEPLGGGYQRKSILFVAWRDLANRQAGGSEVLVDRLASGVLARGHQVTLLCGGTVAERPYRVVCNGMPFLAPLWSRRPVLCLVNHMHTELWSIRFPPPFSTVGRNIERVVMPRVHRENLFLTVSPSTAESLQQIGVGQDRIRQICNGVEAPDPPTPRSPDPMFLAFGRLADYKRLDLLLRLWDRVRHVTGGKLVIAGDGPERPRLEAMAGPGVEFTGRVPDAEKHRLMCAAWLFLHPALIEGWGIVVAEAAIRGTPSVAFDVPGLRDSVVHGQTGMLVRTEGQFASEWASLAIDQRRREQLGQAARTRALQLHWSAAVDGFADVADEAIKRGRTPA